MLNSKNTRELAYLVRVSDIKPIEGKDRVECAIVNGWTCMVPKNTFTPNSIGIYFEIDSLVPPVEPFKFLEKRHYKIKTQKFKNFYSQGLLMSPVDFGWIEIENGVRDERGNLHLIDDETRFLTKKLNITYYDPEDRKRKGNGIDKYKKMAARHPKLFKKPYIRWLMRRNWGKKLLFIFFGKPKDKKNGWPSHIAAKTDVERIQNCIWVLNNKNPYVATEKIDGSSMSVMAERGRFGKIKKYVCSRNVVFETKNDKCFYDTNVYFEMYEKYNLGEVIVKIMNDLNLPNFAIQMEVYGPGIQKRDYSIKDHQIAVFHMLSNAVKFPMDKTVELCEKYGLPHIPIIDDNYILPDNIQELQQYVESEGSKIDGLPKEGIVFYDKETGQEYFKFVSPSFLDKFH